MELRPWERYWQEGIGGQGEHFLRGNRQKEHPSRLRIAVLASKYDSVLECGCATAIDYVYHTQHGTRYTGIDITPKFIESAKKINPDADIRVGNVLDLEFPGSSYDTVYERAVFEHMHPLEWPLAFYEMWRVAKHQVILAFFGWKQNRKGVARISILDRLRSEIPGFPEVKPTRIVKPTEGPGRSSALNHSTSHPDIVDVIESVTDKWSYEQTVKQKGYKTYHIYTAKK